MKKVNVYVIYDPVNKEVVAFFGSRQVARNNTYPGEKVLKFQLDLSKGKVVR